MTGTRSARFEADGQAGEGRAPLALRAESAGMARSPEGLPGRVEALEMDNAALRAALRNALHDMGRDDLRAGVGSWTLDVARNELVCSDACQRILGVPRGEPLAWDTLLRMVPPEDRVLVERVWQAAHAGQPLEVEHRVMAGGQLRRVRMRAVFEFDIAGRVAGGFGIVQDLTERKPSYRTLCEHEELLSVFVDGAPVGIAMFDCEMRYIAVSRRYRDDYFTGEADLIGRSHYDVFPELPERWRQIHRRALAGETLRCEEDPFQRSDGAVTWLRWEVRPWYAASCEIGGIILFTENITERKEAEEALKASKAEAERANNAKSRFLAAASHDLRQPLAALALYMDVLGTRLKPYDGPLLLNMKDCVAGLSEMLNDLLDLSKLEAGVVVPEVRDFPVIDLLNNVLAAHAPEAQSKGLRLGCRTAGQIAHTDPVLLRRMIGNLVSNAVRYTERGGVLVGCRRHAGRTWIEVRDTGIGIPHDKTGEIFEEFKQLGNDERSRERGSGLGLAIVARTAALLGLQIRVASVPGRGSMFAVELPLGQAQPPVATQRLEQEPLRVALVDDNVQVLDAFARSLSEYGHQVVAASCAEQLLERLAGTPPDIVISDYRLAHGATGFEVITAVRAAFGAGLPALVITGDTDPLLMRSMAEHGIRVEHKPLDVDTLQRAIASVTRGSGQ